MPVKTWTSESDFQEWSIVDPASGVVSVDGTIAVADGYPEAVFRSPVYESASWVRNQHVEFDASIPTGANVLVRFRASTTTFSPTEDVGVLPWSDYLDGQLVSGTVQVNTDMYFRNNPTFSNGQFIQYELTLTRG